MIKEPHPIQLQILKKLLFAQGLKYTQLKPDEEMENNKFDFHLDQLVNAQYITRNENLYILTSTGKEFANRMDTDNNKIIRQAKISVFVAAVKKVKNKNYYLIYTRLKQPFYGKQGFLSGKVLLGETIEQAAQREFKEETNLYGKPKIVGIHHYRVYQKTKDNLVEDKFMFYCLIKNPTGILKGDIEGRYEWVEEKDLYTYVTDHFESEERFKKNIKVIKEFKGNIEYEEITQITENF